MPLNWNEDDMERMQEDCLQFLKMVFIDLYFHRAVKTFTIIVLILHVPLAVVQYYYFFKSLNTALFIQYGPTSLIMVYAFTSTVIPLLNENFIHNIYVELLKLSWSIRSGSQTTQEKLKKVALCVTYYAKTSLFLGVITYIFLIKRQTESKEWEIFYQVTFFKEHFPNQAHLLIAIFYVSIFHFILPMMSTFYILGYFTLHLYFQSALVLERIEQITDNFAHDITLVDDDVYQGQISHRLRFCIKRYIDLKQFALTCIGRISEIIVLYMILSFMLIFSYVGAWYLDPDKYYPLILMLCIVSCQVGLVVSEAGELTEGESERIYEKLVASPWYTFDAKNRKIFLLFIGYASKTFSMCPYESFPVNRRLIVQFYKVFSSVSALLANTIHDNN